MKENRNEKNEHTLSGTFQIILTNHSSSLQTLSAFKGLMCGLSIHLPSSPAAEGRGLSASSGNSRQQCSASPLRQDSQGWSIPPLHTTASWRRWRISAKKLNLNQFNIKMNRYHNNVEFTTRSVTMIHLTYARHLYLSECVFITNL